MELDLEKKKIFESMLVWQAIRIMAVPTIISQLIVLIYNMADTFYVGRTNNPLMVAGISMILPIFNITMSLTGLAGVGGGTQISRLLGQGRQEEAKKVSTFSIYLSVGATMVFALVMALFMDPILRLLGASDATIGFARQYTYCVIVIGGVPTVLSNVLSYMLRSVGYSKNASVGIAMGGILNIFLDPLFMFVILPKGYEVLGVGIATCISNCIACVYFFTVLYKTRGQHVISLDIRNGLPEKESIASIFGVGVPSAIVTFLFDLDYVVLDKLMVTYGDVALAAVGIVLKIERLPLNAGIGICQGIVPLVAYNFAAHNDKRRDEIVSKARKLGVLIGLGSICIYQLFAPQLLRFFISDAETVMLGTNFLRARILATPLMFLCFFTVHVFNGYGEGKRALFLGVVRWAVINIPMLFVLNTLVGMYGLVWSQLISDALTVAVTFYVYNSYMKKLRAKKETLA